MNANSPKLSDLKIAIIGLGLMGGSLAMALKGQCKSISAVDTDPQTLQLAHENKIVDILSSNLEEIIPGIDVIILATPVNTIVELLEQLPALISDNAIVMDIGSTKKSIVDAMNGLPERLDPIGGHPMCGKELLSLKNADPLLYSGAPFALIRLERTSSRAIALAKQLCQRLQAHPVWIDADTHDQWVALTSHLPYLISSAMVKSLPDEAAALIGPGFLGMARLASTPSSMMMDVLIDNENNIVNAIDYFQSCLESYKKLLAFHNHQELGSLLDEAAAKKQGLFHQ